jgi:hypothetical protein
MERSLYFFLPIKIWKNSGNFLDRSGKFFPYNFQLYMREVKIFIKKGKIIKCIQQTLLAITHNSNSHN